MVDEKEISGVVKKTLENINAYNAPTNKGDFDDYDEPPNSPVFPSQSASTTSIKIKSETSPESTSIYSNQSSSTSFNKNKITEIKIKREPPRPPSPEPTCTQQVIDDEDFPFDFDEDFDEPTTSSAAVTNKLPMPSDAFTQKEAENSDGFITTAVRFIGNVTNDATDKNLQREDFDFSKQLFEALHSIFGIKKFRPNQLQSVNAALLKKDCFILMPTGGGKSLCYQLPATLFPGVTVVVSPLVSLIHDQVTKLKDLGVASEHLSGENCDWRSVFDDLRRVGGPSIKLLYVTPEKIKGSNMLRDAFSSLHRGGNLSRFVIDEAHCVSGWGHDFRPDYCDLKELKQNYPGVPFMALTATATPRVRADVVSFDLFDATEIQLIMTHTFLILILTYTG